MHIIIPSGIIPNGTIFQLLKQVYPMYRVLTQLKKFLITLHAEQFYLYIGIN